jgi:hypothetical protein
MVFFPGQITLQFLSVWMGCHAAKISPSDFFAMNALSDGFLIELRCEVSPFSENKKKLYPKA